MKYFDIDMTVRHHTYNELKQDEKFPRILNVQEKFNLLCDQCKELKLQPHDYPDGSGFELLPACKKFLNGERQYKEQRSKRELQYIEFIKTGELPSRNYSAEYSAEKKRVAKNYMFKATEEDMLKLDEILKNNDMNFAEFVREAIKKEATR